MQKMNLVVLSLLFLSLVLAGCERKYTDRELAPAQLARETVSQESLIAPKINFNGNVPAEKDRWVELTYTDTYTGVKLEETLEVGEDGTLYHSPASVLQAGGPNYSGAQTKVKAVFHGKRGEIYDFRFPMNQSLTINTVPVDK